MLSLNVANKSCSKILDLELAFLVRRRVIELKQLLQHMMRQLSIVMG